MEIMHCYYDLSNLVSDAGFRWRLLFLEPHWHWKCVLVFKSSYWPPSSSTLSGVVTNDISLRLFISLLILYFDKACKRWCKLMVTFPLVTFSCRCTDFFVRKIGNEMPRKFSTYPEVCAVIGSHFIYIFFRGGNEFLLRNSNSLF